MYTYEELKGFVDHCSRCRLCQTRNHPVMGKGNLQGKILFIAEVPGNRDPYPDEQEACIPYLKYETLLLRPKIMVCLGRIAAQRIIKPDYRITREHGVFIERKNTWLTAVYHPSAALRDETKLPQMQEDFQKIRKKWEEITGFPENL